MFAIQQFLLFSPQSGLIIECVHHFLANSNLAIQFSKSRGKWQFSPVPARRSRTGASSSGKDLSPINLNARRTNSLRRRLILINSC